MVNIPSDNRLYIFWPQKGKVGSKDAHKTQIFKKQEPQRGFSSLGQPGHLSPPPLLCRLVLLPDLPQWHLLTKDNDDGAPQLPGVELDVVVGTMLVIFD